MTLRARTGISGLEAGGLGASALCDSQPGPYRLRAQGADPPTRPQPWVFSIGAALIQTEQGGDDGVWLQKAPGVLGVGQPGVPTARGLHQ